MESYSCPICGVDLDPNSRYPRFVCQDCALRATDESGRKVEFFNSGMGGGYVAYYAGTNQKEKYQSHECYIDGVRCYADEAHMGGIVVQVVDSEVRGDPNA